MKRIKKIIYLSLFCFLFYFSINEVLQDKDVLNSLMYKKQDIVSSKKTNDVIFKIGNILFKNNNKLPFNLLNSNYNSYNVIKDNDIVKVSKTNVEKKDPLVYIYNTHDSETYVNPNKELYNITANVKTASYILQDRLKFYGINSVVEERSPTKIVSKNKEEYKNTYQYSRSYFIEAKEKYPSIKYFIDLHRDGVDKSISTVVIDNKSYARLMFFLGMGHSESEKNKALVKSLESYINNNYNGLLRNTFIREYDSYNQDLSPNSFLIEVGGQHNTIEEVYYSVSVLAESLANYIKEHDE